MSAGRGVLAELAGRAGEIAAAESRAARRKSCEGDFFRFCSTYLPHYFSAEPAPYHRIMMDVASDMRLGEGQIEALRPLLKERWRPLMRASGRLSGIVDVEPRGFSKSTRFSLAYPLWAALYGKRRFLVLFASSQALAEERLGAIKVEIEENERLAEDFGETRGGVWKSDRIALSNGAAMAARGALSSVRGVRNGPDRPDVAICDDVMTDAAASSPSQREKLYRWFKRVVLPLGKDMFPIVINTVFHEDDLACRLLGEIEDGRLKGWAGFRFAALAPDGASLWPSYWSAGRLERKREEMGGAAWSTEMMCEPLSSEDAIIKTFHYYDLKDVSFEGRRRYGGIDPSAGSRDKCAFCTLVDGGGGVLYVADTWGERLSEGPFLERIIGTFAAWGHCAVGFEDVAFQGIYKRSLMEKAAARGAWLPMRGRKTGGLSKQERAREMAPLIEGGFIRFRRDQRELVGQLSMFTADGPKSAYDDEADALWIAFKEAQAAGSRTVYAEHAESPEKHYVKGVPDGERIALVSVGIHVGGADGEARLALEAVGVTAGFKRAYALDEEIRAEPYQTEGAAEWIASFAARLGKGRGAPVIVFARWEESLSLRAAARRKIAGERGVEIAMRGAPDAPPLERAALAQSLLGAGRLLLSEGVPDLRAALASARWEAGKPGAAPSRVEAVGGESLMAFESAIMGIARYFRA
jgi:predicted phage terminase large subunit-like protein